MPDSEPPNPLSGLSKFFRRDEFDRQDWNVITKKTSLIFKGCEVLSGRRPSVTQRPFVKPAVYFAND